MNGTRMRIVTIFGLLALAAMVAGCGSGSEDPAPAVDASSQGRTLAVPNSSGDTGIVPPVAGSGTGSTGLQWDTPSTWIAETPANAMRKAQYKAPGDAGDGECVVFYFGPGQGGTPMANAVRWAEMFSQPDGSDTMAKLKTREENIGGIPVLLVETTGTYSNPMGGGPTIPDAMLLGAIVEGPDANWFFKLTGPKSTIEDHREAFTSMIGSVRAGS